MTPGFVHDHPYLVADLGGLVTVAICWSLARAQRRMMLLSGALFALFSPIAATFDGPYWSPRLVEVAGLLPIHLLGGSFGIEDALLLFIAGARAWFFATLPARQRWMATASPLAFVRRAAVLTVVAIAICAVFQLLGLRLLASYVIPAAIGCVLLALRPEHWRLALMGALGSALLASLELRLWFALWPDWRAAWAPGAFTSIDVLGIKLGDVLWWLVIGAVHPLAIAYCAAARLRPRGSAAS